MNKPQVLYLSYTGLLEPLGRSQILAYLSRLSAGFEFTIVSFEKPDDFNNTQKRQAMQRECQALGITWLPKGYHQKPRLLATLWDLWVLLYSTWALTRSGKAQLVHCRSYIPAMAAWLAGKFTKVPFVFDMRALWLDEMIAAGRLKPKGFVHWVLRKVEQRLLTQSRHIVSLTQAGVEHLLQQNPGLARDKFSVITTCVDLNNFATVAKKPEKFYWGTMGTISSGWYHLDWLFRFFQQVLQQDANAEFKIISRDNARALQAKANTYGITPDRLTIKAANQNDIAQNIADISAGLLFFTEGVAKLGSAPTRMGEFLACGLPVIGNRGVGDMATLIEQYKVGVVLEDGSDQALVKALQSLQQLQQDPELAKRCRQTAEDYFSADSGAKNYQRVYQKVIGANS